MVKPPATPLIIGTSHKNSSIEYRERLAGIIENGSMPKNLPVDEWALLKTCNRVELIFVSNDIKATADRVFAWARAKLGETQFYVLEDGRAVTHLFRVAAGLDSMTINDRQILGQLRGASRQARKLGTSRSALPPLFDAAVNAGLRARIAFRGASTSEAEFAVRKAVQELGRQPRGVLLIGTGKMSKIAASLLKGSRIRVVSRRTELPDSLAGASMVGWDAIPKALQNSELIVSATNHPGFSIKAGDLSGDRKKVIVDLGFPRNVEPSVRAIPGVRLFDLDDLAEMSPHRRVTGTAQAESIVKGEAAEFENWLRASKLSPEVPELFRWADKVRTDETEAALRRFQSLTPKQRRLIETMGRRITSKILARPAAFAKQSSEELPQEERMRIIRAVFME